MTMQITLTKDLEKFVTRKVRSGGYADTSEVVREALREFRSQEDPAEHDSRELAELLLPAVRGPHRPMTARHFAQLRQRARRRPAQP
jgi:putative addiction module CopG family antidote